MIESRWAATGLGGILHCFTGNGSMPSARWMRLSDLLRRATSPFPKRQTIREVAARVPLDRMLIETDAPFLAPVPYRGKRNEPAWVGEVAEQIGSGPAAEYPTKVGFEHSQQLLSFFWFAARP